MANEFKKLNASQYKGMRYDENSYIPMGQQHFHSHVVVPVAIALILAIFAFLLVYAIQVWLFGTLLPLVPLIVFSLVFVGIFLHRIAKADQLLWQVEAALGVDLDDDGHVGMPFLPRKIPLKKGGKEQDLDLAPTAEGLTAEEWNDVAISLLSKCNRVSRRGLHTERISQAKAQMASNVLHQYKYADDALLTPAGFDWLHAYLPAHVQCLLDRPEELEEIPA